MSFLIAHLTPRMREAVRGVWREAARFGVVGALAFVLDNGGYTLLVFGLPGAGVGPMHSTPVQASVVATGFAMGFSWVGNRYWVYRRRHRKEAVRELALFAFVNVIGMVITAGSVFLSRHLLGLDSALSDNAARISGWAVATLFRFFTYRRYVFVPS
ncbi:GtrA family protein [Streptomyces viridochromogenes]|uniref:Putative Monosaccharide translocase n=1 Tax=Streptomyces viridochromogenes Tue57 TaxID=1160705 RepID=L8PAF9_STRVR|nr:GtrA family protein [Streptomyces viridochromogenes]ELS53415.1 putative Monosaccharide translocase [Streptomyces viridochromogenes Tue57]